MIKRGPGERVFDFMNAVFMILIFFITLYPFYYIICASMSRNSLLAANPGIMFWPRGFNLGAYALTFKYRLVKSGFRNIFIILAASLPLNIFLTLICAYILAAKKMMFKNLLVSFVLFTMFFSGGLVPNFLNIQDLKLYNSLWALILPGAISVYNSIIVKTAIEQIPDSLIEAAYIDGANDIYVLFKIIARVITPTLAVIILYYAVGHWNSWFAAVIYMKDNDKLPIQAVLRAILLENESLLNSTEIRDDEINRFAETIKYALIVVGTLPILVSYPFLQKYFIKGVMIGAIKG